MMKIVDPVLRDLQERVCEANHQLHRSGLVPLTWGNVSEREAFQDSYVVGIKPSGVPYERIRPKDIVVLNSTGQIVASSLRPSSDTPTHLYLYSELAHWNGITHTHSTFATAWAQTGRDIPILGTTHADYFPRSIPCTSSMTEEEVTDEYEIETGSKIVTKLREASATQSPMVLVHGHGAFAFGNSGATSVDAAIALEAIAQIATLCLAIHPVTKEIPTHLINRHYSRKHGPNSYYGQVATEPS